MAVYVFHIVQIMSHIIHVIDIFHVVHLCQIVRVIQRTLAKLRRRTAALWRRGVQYLA